MKFTKEELGYLRHIMWHFTDYMAMDDRPDHGMGILKEYRELPQEEKSKIYILAGRIGKAYKNMCK